LKFDFTVVEIDEFLFEIDTDGWDVILGESVAAVLANDRTLAYASISDH
jgi:hypothetical protein